ncbi:serine protease [Geomicrobium sediminis]|uniref:RNase H-like nuclease (RuvC/YqgF family) n=1 Tax=Geomicrobium sediminis TaxID=1347788 RepID=A0ABS2PDR6_9BACL|nr:serine protease [Geomicrobium sediminis]MBM7633126.1 putative RNase H-like nuclease (RuvC/YqgF family) [Geomicrobium sediminis]
MDGRVKQIEHLIEEKKVEVEQLEATLEHIQQQCSHHFSGDELMRRCLMCNKVEVLYY